MAPTTTATAKVAMPSLACALGPVQVSSTWGERRPAAHSWKMLKPVLGHGWKTTRLPGPDSGKF